MRHGTVLGYLDGCREPCCSVPKALDNRRRNAAIAAGHEFQVSSARSVRKVQALAALGWSSKDVGKLMGISQQAISRILARPTIRSTTARRIDRAYDELEMKIPPDNIYTRRTRNYAASQGWLPPLAYDDIDAGIVAVDDDVPDQRYHDSIDEWNVEQALQYHDFSMKLSRAEKEEIMRRWIRSGRTEMSLCELTGWKEGRYS